MKKIISKITKIFVIMVFLAPTFMMPQRATGQTLGDLKAELSKKQAEYEESQNAKKLTEAEQVEVKKQISATEADIDKTYEDIAVLDEEIKQLNLDIEKKNQEMQELVSFVQISDGQPAYLEYVFGAKDFTDFIYRVSVTEQLADYNDQLIDEYNALIKENEDKQEELLTKRQQLADQKEQLQKKYKELQADISEFDEHLVDVSDEIASQKEIIEIYESLNCGDNEDISVCGRDTLPAGTSFYRPMETGYATSNYGYRDLFGKKFHGGLDMGNRTYGANVYAIGAGKVVNIIYQASCGGNYIVIHHYINGRTYTSIYMHLRTVNVRVGDIVTQNTIIATMGGGSDTWWYDHCSTGGHLHLTIANGLYGIDYTSWSTMYYSKSVDPRTLINFPAGLYNSWANKTTKY